MEMSQGNSLCTYLKQKYHFSFFYKITEWNRSCLENWYQWEGRGGGERVWEGEDGANSVYTCMKMEK
jgi:hypothetical protein